MVLQADERQQLKQKANEIRKEIVKITYTCGGAHIGGSLSQTDLMVAIYYKYLKFDPKNPDWEDRDRFLLSKGHGRSWMTSTRPVRRSACTSTGSR